MPRLILLRGRCEQVVSEGSPTGRSPRLASSLIECLTGRAFAASRSRSAARSHVSSDVRVERNRRTEMNSSSSFMALSLDRQLTSLVCSVERAPTTRTRPIGSSFWVFRHERHIRSYHTARQTRGSGQGGESCPDGLRSEIFICFHP